MSQNWPTQLKTMTDTYTIYRTPKGDHQVRATDDPPPPDWGWEEASVGWYKQENACAFSVELDADSGIYHSQPEGSDPVDHPAHYTGPVPNVECIEVTRHFDFLRGNAIKYIWRAAHKGRYVEDLRKAVWYLNKAIEQGCPQD